MSNIQITENRLGKYSPEWFYNESQTSEWTAFTHKADELRKNFINLFGIEQLKSFSGRDLLTSLFYNDEGNKSNPHTNLVFSFIKKLKDGLAVLLQNLYSLQNLRQYKKQKKYAMI